MKVYFNSIHFLLLRLYFTRVLDTYPNTGLIHIVCSIVAGPQKILIATLKGAQKIVFKTF